MKVLSLAEDVDLTLLVCFIDIMLVLVICCQIGILKFEAIYGYTLECPVDGHLTILNRRVCNDSHKYSCIYDENERKHRPTCRAPVQTRPGYYVTLLGDIYTRECVPGTYQPFKFWTNASSQCILQKSLCADEGSVLVDNGTIRSDVKCRCNYKDGYSYIIPPKDKCGCVPSEEDCSCYKMPCPRRQVLSQDYTCIDLERWSGRFVCPNICTEDFTMKCPSFKEIYLRDKEISTTKEDPENKILVFYFILTLSTLMIVVTAALWLILDWSGNRYGNITKEIDKERRGNDENLASDESYVFDKGQAIDEEHVIVQDIENVVVKRPVDENQFEDETDDDSTSEEHETSKDNQYHDVIVDLHTTSINVELCKTLLKHESIGINICDNEGRSPLMHACNLSDEDTAILLIDYGADLNTADKLGNTPLTIACENNMISVAGRLLQQNVDVNVKNGHGNTALSLACMNGNMKIIDMLLGHGADPSIQDQDGWTPLIQALHCKRKEND